MTISPSPPVSPPGTPPASTRRSSGRHDRTFYESLWRAIVEKNEWQGEIWNRKKSGQVYPEWLNISAILGSNGRPTHYVAVFSDITSVKRSEEQLVYLANHDHLTGLPNRTLLLDRLSQALAVAQRSGQPVALVLVDLDDFKSVNGSIGLHLGDQVLCQVAERLRTLVREADTVARTGGDDFAVMLTGLRDAADSMRLVQKLQAGLAEPYTLDGHEISLTSCIGVALWPQDGTTATAIHAAADGALYAARAVGQPVRCRPAR